MKFKLFKTIYGVQKEQGWWYAVVKKTFLGVCYSTKYIEETGFMLFSKSAKNVCDCGFYHSIDAEKIIRKFKENQEKVQKRKQDSTSFKEVV